MPVNIGETFDFDLDNEASKQGPFLKRTYAKMTRNLFNQDSVLFSRIRQDRNKVNFQGHSYRPNEILSFQGGFGAGDLPFAGSQQSVQADVQVMNVYQRASVTRKSMKVAKTSKGSYVRVMGHVTKEAVTNFRNNMNRILFGDGTGILGVGASGGTMAAGIGDRVGWIGLTMANTGKYRFNAAKFEEKSVVTIMEGIDTTNPTAHGTTRESVFVIEQVDKANRTVWISGTAIAGKVAGGANFTEKHAIVMQRSYNKEPMGLLGALSGESTGNLYKVSRANRRWQATVFDANERTVALSMLKNISVDVNTNFGSRGGKCLFMAHPTQYKTICEILGESEKEYRINSRNMTSQKLNAQTSFYGVSVQTDKGPVGLFMDRHCQEDTIYYLNEDFITYVEAPDGGWFDDDGTVFMRETDQDAYEGRYGQYNQFYIVPSAHGVIRNLRITG